MGDEIGALNSLKIKVTNDPIVFISICLFNPYGGSFWDSGSGVLNRGSLYLSAHVLLNLLNELGKI